MKRIPGNISLPSKATIENADALYRAGVTPSVLGKSLGIKARTMRSILWFWRHGAQDEFPDHGGPDFAKTMRVSRSRGGVTRSRRVKIKEQSDG